MLLRELCLYGLFAFMLGMIVGSFFRGKAYGQRKKKDCLRESFMKKGGINPLPPKDVKPPPGPPGQNRGK